MSMTILAQSAWNKLKINVKCLVSIDFAKNVCRNGFSIQANARIAGNNAISTLTKPTKNI
jgi:hypothetical protein